MYGLRKRNRCNNTMLISFQFIALVAAMASIGCCVASNEHVENYNYHHARRLRAVTTTTTTGPEPETTPTATTTSKEQHDDHKDHYVMVAEAITKLEANDSNNVITSLREYYASVNEFIARNIVLFYWNSDGILEKVSPVSNMDKVEWLNFDANPYLLSLFNVTSKSKYGKIAMLYNNDVADGWNWNVFDINPPVPIMFYTMPKQLSSKEKEANFHLVPNPYDRNGGSHNYITVVRKHLRYLSSSLTSTDDDRTKPIATYDEFLKRKDEIVWRGDIHAGGDESRRLLLQLGTEQENSKYHSNNQWLDVANSREHPEKRLKPEVMSSDYKYQIDIGGISGTAWDGLRWKMCGSGSVVLKVESPFRDWWHSTLVPWKHYVPIKEDLSDLRSLYMWLQYNPEIAYNISIAGQQVCLQTSTKEYAQQVQKDMIYQLPEASTMDLIEEVNVIFQERYNM